MIALFHVILSIFLFPIGAHFDELSRTTDTTRFDELLHLGDRGPDGGWHKATVKDVETAFSKFSSRSGSVSDLEDYLLARIIYEHLTMSYYMDPLHRYLQLRAYANTARTENNWINELADFYGQGDLDNIVVVIGDWCKEGARRFKQKDKYPAAYSRIIQRMRAAGVAVFLVHEAYTSKRCSSCCASDAECSGEGISDILVGHGRRRYTRRQESHGRIICSKCGLRYNRDVNASKNILFLARHLLEYGKRPDYLPEWRSENNAEADSASLITEMTQTSQEAAK